jgi:inorganic pyrophosphatase
LCVFRRFTEDLNPDAAGTFSTLHHYSTRSQADKVIGWEGKDAAHKEIVDGMAAYEAKKRLKEG